MLTSTGEETMNALFARIKHNPTRQCFFRFIEECYLMLALMALPARPLRSDVFMKDFAGMIFL